MTERVESAAAGPALGTPAGASHLSIVRFDASQSVSPLQDTNQPAPEGPELASRPGVLSLNS